MELRWLHVAAICLLHNILLHSDRVSGDDSSTNLPSNLGYDTASLPYSTPDDQNEGFQTSIPESNENSEATTSSDSEEHPKDGGSNEKGNGSGSDEDSDSNEDSDSIKTEALNSYDRYRYNDYNNRDRYSSNGYDHYRYQSYNWHDYNRYSWNDYYRSNRYDFYGGKRYRSPKSWNTHYDRYDYNYHNLPWPRHENRWSNPQDDKWNFAFSSKDQCNTVDVRGLPDQLSGYSDQAVQFPGAEHFKFGGVNVSAYDVYTERCCQGKTYPKYPNGKYSCCGSSEYDTTREVCCDGKMAYPQQLGYECCAGKYINTDSDICCFSPEKGVVVKQLPPSARDDRDSRLFSQCCGDTVYDTKSHICFMVTSGGEELLNFTVIEKKYNHTGCCEGKPYNQDVENCDEVGKTYTYLSGPPCVFKQAYERIQHRLRSADSEYRPYYWSEYSTNYYRHDNFWWRYDRYNFLTCRDKMYNYHSQICCGDRYGDEANGTVKIWDRMENSDCCGTEIYNRFSHQCCDGQVVEKTANIGSYQEDECCGKKSYNYRKEWCCAGSNTVVKSQEDLGQHCCGPEGLVYNRTSHVCCNSRLVEIPRRADKSYKGDWLCCTSSDSGKQYQLYEAYTGKCCGGTVYSISQENRWKYKCCGDEMFDYTEKSCCGEQILNGSYSCCGNKELYSPDTHTCCYGSVLEKPSSHATSCCGKTPYDYQLQTCCHDTAKSEWLATYKRSRNEQCCGGKAYDTDRQSCCGSSILINDTKKSYCCEKYDDETGKWLFAAVERKPNSELSSCCGLSAIDWETEACCNGNVVAKVIGKDMECCGTNLYDSKSQLCCFGEVYDRADDDSKKCCGKKAYDVTKQICCRGVPLPVNDVDSAMCCYQDSKEVLGSPQ